MLMVTVLLRSCTMYAHEERVKMITILASCKAGIEFEGSLAKFCYLGCWS